jgi:lipoyl(octanoyl) transferase
MTQASPLCVRRLGVRDYAPTWEAMRAFTAARTAATPDEVWLLQHPPVYTLGRNGKHPPLSPASAHIPFVHTDRGGDVTYHAPGQWVAYALLDLRRRGLGAKALVQALEQTIIDLLADYGLVGARRAGAPGVYVDGRKIAALGLRVRAQGSYHGLALNVDMDLAPFGWINPCGYAGLEVTQLADLGIRVGLEPVGAALLAHLAQNLGYNPALSLAEGPFDGPSQAAAG